VRFRLLVALQLTFGSACTYGVVGTMPSSDDAVIAPGGTERDATDVGAADGATDAGAAEGTLGSRDASAPDAAVCSRGGGDNVNVTFVNQSSTRTYDKLWVRGDCSLRSYGNIGPGQTQKLASYGGHVWSFRDTTTGNIVKTVRLGQNSPETLNIP
jgi:hypothetical protein